MTSIPRRNLTGVLLLDKPAGITSNTTLSAAKRLFQALKAGHTGTLDPFATGLLPVCFGEAAKFSRFLLDADKSYRATLKLGMTTTTGDTEGAVKEICPIRIDESSIRNVLARFHGVRTQIPPMYSALKREGIPLYKLARQGIEIEREPRHIEIHDLQFIEWQDDKLVIDVTCSKGTYIRVLAEEIGEALGCGAHLNALRRTASGKLHIEQATSLKELEDMTCSLRDEQLLPVDTLAQDIPEWQADHAIAMGLQQGKSYRLPLATLPVTSAGYARVYTEEKIFIGVVRIERDDATHLMVTAERMMSAV